MMRNELVPLLARLLTFGYLATCTFGRGLGIPGTQMTLDGYDNDKSKNPICWTTRGRDDASTTLVPRNDPGFRFQNPLIPGFTTTEGVKLLSTCSQGMHLEVMAPFAKGEIPRTGREYNYKVKATIDFGENEFYLVRESPSQKKCRAAIQILFCDLEVGGFCSPFVHEQANTRGHTEPTPPGFKHGGSHIHSAYVFVELDTTVTRHEIEVPVPTVVNEAGSYFVIGAMQFFVDLHSEKDDLLRYDIANAADNRLERFQDPPSIASVPRNIEFAIIAAVGFVVLVMAFCLFECIRHKRHKIMKLCQVYFLIVSLVAGIVSVAATTLQNPNSDLNCVLQSPLTMIPAQLIYSITIGRLWRIHMVVSPFLKESYESKAGKVFADLLSRVARGCFTKEQITPKLRTVVSWKDMANLVVFFTFPQVILQIVSIFIQPQAKTIELNKSQTIGRLACRSYGTFTSITNYGFSYLFGTTVLLLILANSWKNLPSLFNEVELIRRSTILNIVVLLLGLTIMAVSRDPDMGPEFDYVIWIVIVVTLVINSTVALIFPKLRMIWRGDNILVSKLMSDFRASQSRDNEGPHGVTGLESLKMTNLSITQSNGSCDEEAASTPRRLFSKFRKNSKKNSLVAALSPCESVELNDVESRPCWAEVFEQNRQKSPIVLHEDQAPSRLILVPMLQFEQLLVPHNSKIMSGASTSLDDWVRLRQMALQLSLRFDRVEFDEDWIHFEKALT